MHEWYNWWLHVNTCVTILLHNPVTNHTVLIRALLLAAEQVVDRYLTGSVVILTLLLRTVPMIATVTVEDKTLIITLGLTIEDRLIIVNIRVAIQMDIQDTVASISCIVLRFTIHPCFPCCSVIATTSHTWTFTLVICTALNPDKM